MVRIVLSEPDRDGVFTPQLAVTTGDETEALTFSLYGVSHSVTAYANRLGSVGKLSNRIDISQAMGGVPQAVTFDFDLIDWDGFGRVSISLFEAAGRLVGRTVCLSNPQSQRPPGNDPMSQSACHSILCFCLLH